MYALKQAMKDYPGPKYVQADLERSPITSLNAFDTITAFEVLEHLQNDVLALVNWRINAKQLLLSVPAEEKVKWAPSHPYHYRHYTKAQLSERLKQTGWVVKEWLCQRWNNEESVIEPGTHGTCWVVHAV